MERKVLVDEQPLPFRHRMGADNRMNGLRKDPVPVVDAQQAVGPAIRPVAGMGGGQPVQELLVRGCQGVVRRGLAGEDRVASRWGNGVQIQDAAQRRFGIAGHVGMPVFAVRALGRSVSVDWQDFRMPLWPWGVRVDVQVAEMAAEGFLLVQVDLLIAEKQDLVFGEGGVQVLDLLVA